ncbi:UNVERIFIED_CONTAM: hypothetical protein NCL1_19284 [Trichonephila clavipes]
MSVHCPVSLRNKPTKDQISVISQMLGTLQEKGYAITKKKFDPPFSEDYLLGVSFVLQPRSHDKKKKGAG